MEVAGKPLRARKSSSASAPRFVSTNTSVRPCGIIKTLILEVAPSVSILQAMVTEAHAAIQRIKRCAGPIFGHMLASVVSQHFRGAYCGQWVRPQAIQVGRSSMLTLSATMHPSSGAQTTGRSANCNRETPLGSTTSARPVLSTRLRKPPACCHLPSLPFATPQEMEAMNTLPAHGSSYLDGVNEVQQDLTFVVALHELHMLHDEVCGAAHAAHCQKDVVAQEVARQPLDFLRRSCVRDALSTGEQSMQGASTEAYCSR